MPRPPPSGAAATASDQRLRLYRWYDPAILVTAALAGSAGFAQFGVSSALADVARSFGQPSTTGSSVAANVGLSFTVLGIGLAIIRLAALGSLPLSGLADRLGRRRVLLGCTAGGLAISALAALSPGYWWFVALVAVGWGAGTGAIAVVRGVAGDALSWRGLFALLVIPLALIPLFSRWLEEPDRFRRSRAGAPRQPAAAGPSGGVAGATGRAGRFLARPTPALRPRLWLIAVLTAMLGFVTGPANAMMFVYAESVLGLPRSATAAMVAAAGVLGRCGLIAGRWAADRLGRRYTAGTMQAVIALAAVLTYSGSAAAAVTGYLLAICAASVFSPAAGALATEMFPTSVRATVAGWMSVGGVLGAVCGLIVFGLLVTALNSFWVAAVMVALPVVALCPLYGRFPETLGMELEESAPE